jgi:hypothetical protein
MVRSSSSWRVDPQLSSAESDTGTEVALIPTVVLKAVVVVTVPGFVVEAGVDSFSLGHPSPDRDRKIPERLHHSPARWRASRADRRRVPPLYGGTRNRYGLFEKGYTSSLSYEGVSAIAAASAEVGAVSKALNANPKADLTKASLQTSFYGFDVRDFMIAAGYPI